MPPASKPVKAKSPTLVGADLVTLIGSKTYHQLV
jgi:hypothetical protein